MHRITVHPEQKLVIGVFQGSVTLEEHKELKLSLAEHDQVDDDYRGVLDYRHAEIDMSVSDVEQLAEEAKALGASGGRWALLIDAPKETALSMIYLNRIGSGQQENIFASVVHASQFLGLDLAPFLENATSA